MKTKLIASSLILLASFAQAAPNETITTPKLASYAQVTPPAPSVWSGAIFVDIRHKDASVVVLRTITTQHDVFGVKGFDVTASGFLGYSIRSSNAVTGLSIGVSRRITAEGATLYAGISGSAPITKNPFDVGLGFTVGLSVPIGK